ncbi:MAG: hypothetical protein JWL85_179, partial [Candidatus Saccharibacteria bacterium]|nr:hypothetical protein [Candidatus Saccharibacteria bacterium]
YSNIYHMSEQSFSGSNDPSLTGGNAVPDSAEQRRQIEGDVGSLLDRTLETHKQFTEEFIPGAERLILYVPNDSGKVDTVSILTGTRDDGRRFAFMGTTNNEVPVNLCMFTFGRNDYEFGENDRKPHLEVAVRESANVPFRPLDPDDIEDRNHRDYAKNADAKVAQWGPYWADALRNGTPEKPRKQGFFK